MDNDQLFDEMLRMKLQQRSFGSAEAGWQKMEALLPPERKRKVVGLRFTFLLCLFAALAGGGFVFFLLSPGETISKSRTTGTLENTNSSDRVQSALPGFNGSNSTTRAEDNTHADAVTDHDLPAQDENIFSPLNKAPLHPERNHVAVVSYPQQDHLALQEEKSAMQRLAENTNDAYKQQPPHTGSAITPALATLAAPEGTDSVCISTLWHPEINYWLIQCGASYTAPFSASGSAQPSFSPVAGIGYNVWLNPAWSLRAGLRYSMITNVSDVRSTTAEEIAAGVISYSESHLQQLHYASLPLQVYRRVGNRHAFTAGYTLNFLMAARQQTLSYTDSNGSISNESSSRSFSHSGFSSFDGLFTAGYSFTLNKRMQAEASVYSGLTDIMHNDRYGNRFERNRGVMLMLSYSF